MIFYPSMPCGMDRGRSRTGGMMAFLRRMPSNLKVMVVRGSVANLVINVNPYNSLYIVALGATGTQLGLLNSVGLALSMTAALLTGWISDRADRKKVFLVGSLFWILVPLAYGLSWTWFILVPAFVFWGISEGIMWPAWSAIYANSVDNKNRGTIYGLVNVFTQIPVLVAGLIGGAIASHFGGLTVTGIRPIYWVQFGLLTLTWIYVAKSLNKEPRPTRKVPLSTKAMIDDYKEVLKKEGTRSWVLMKSLGSISIGIAGPFWMVYAADVHGASAMTIAYMVTLRGAAQILFSPVAGRLIDAVGRKKMIISGRLIMYLATVVFLLRGETLMLILAWVLMGVNDAAGIAWSAQEAELVKPDERSRMTALSHGAFNALAIPASILGGFLWDNMSPMYPFIIMILIDGLVRMPIIHFFVPEGKTNPSEGDGGSYEGFSLD